MYLTGKTPAQLRDDADRWRIQSAAYGIAAEVAEDLAARLENEPASDLATVVNHAYDHDQCVRILYTSEQDDRPRWRIVQPTTEVRMTQASPLGTYFRALDIAAPDGEDRRCYRLSRVEAYEPYEAA